MHNDFKRVFSAVVLVLATGNIFLSVLPMFLSSSWYPESSGMCELKEFLRMDTLRSGAEGGGEVEQMVLK